MALVIEGTVNRAPTNLGIGIQRGLRLSTLGSASVVELEPRNSDASRAGLRFGGGLQVIANAVAPVQVIPTTGPTTTLYNGDSLKSYIIDWITFSLASGTAGVGATLFAAVSPTKIASPPAASVSNWTVASMSGSSKSASKALWASSVTIPGAPSYIPVALAQNTAAATAGIGTSGMDLAGSIIIPPGFGLGLDILAGAGTSAKFGIYASWIEVQLDLE